MEARLELASKVLDSTITKQIPKHVLKDCKGVAILEGSEFAFGLTGGFGSGVLVKHNGDSWGPPIAIDMNFVGIGADLGVAEKNVLIFPMTDEALKKLTKDTKMTFGAELGIACGPGIETQAGAVDVSPIFTYTWQKGLMLQAGLTGSVIMHSKEANEKFYGVDKSPSEIALGEVDVTVPEGNKYLDDLYAKLGSIETAE